MQHSFIETQEHPIFIAVMGPFFGTRLMITTAQLESAGKRLVEQFLHDTLRFTTPESARVIFQNYGELQRKSKTTQTWAPTWFERQIVTSGNHKDKLQHELQSKRKKMEEDINPNKATEEQQTIYHNHKQQATKILSDAASSNDVKRFKALEKSVAELQENNVELIATIGTMKDNQYRDQTKMIGLQTQLENANRKLEGQAKELRKCQMSIQTVETKLSTLSTADDANKRFDRIESMIAGMGGHQIHKSGEIVLTGKRKEKVADIETEQEEEQTFEDSPDIMETDEYGILTKIIAPRNEGHGYHTNNQQENSISETWLK
jgi:chromosome segregation ATPase